MKLIIAEEMITNGWDALIVLAIIAGICFCFWVMNRD